RAPGDHWPAGADCRVGDRWTSPLVARRGSEQLLPRLRQPAVPGRRAVGALPGARTIRAAVLARRPARVDAALHRSRARPAHRQGRHLGCRRRQRAVRPRALALRDQSGVDYRADYVRDLPIRPARHNRDAHRRQHSNSGTDPAPCGGMGGAARQSLDRPRRGGGVLRLLRRARGPTAVWEDRLILILDWTAAGSMRWHSIPWIFRPWVLRVTR